MPDPARPPLPLPPLARPNLGPGPTAQVTLWVLGTGFLLMLCAIGYHRATASTGPGSSKSTLSSLTTGQPATGENAEVLGASLPGQNAGRSAAAGSGGSSALLPEGSRPPQVIRPGGPVPDTPLRPVPLTERTFMGNAPTLVTALMDQARELRFHGDLTSALVKLREARLIEPRNGTVLAEIAYTYDQMGNPRQAQAYWLELRSLGDAAGVLRELADYKLGNPGTPGAAAASGIDPSEFTLGEGRDPLGLPPNARMGFNEIIKEQNKGPEGEPFLTVRLSVRARATPAIEPRDVTVLVYFYETVEDKFIVQTNADVGYHWISLPADWRGTNNVEILEVDYRQPGALPGDELPPEIREGLEIRKYYGYIARVYYGGELQDAAAEPASLLTQFPPPATLPME